MNCPRRETRASRTKQNKTNKNKMNENKIVNKQGRQRGTTLIELSVVIAVLLLLVGVLFIGITAWRNGANTAACIVNLASIQKAARGYANMNGLLAGATEPSASLAGASGFWVTAPACPTGVGYVWGTVVPAQGTAYASCTVSGHVPSATNLANW
jgi:prepilin-type N-terminal cleavage/methylation domain-containing protein